MQRRDLTQMRWMTGAAALAAMLPTPAFATAPDAPAGQSTVVDALIRCRAIATDAARLRCFDDAARVFSGAISTRSVVVVDREQIERERRARFGERRRAPELPSLVDQSGDKVDAVTGKLARAAQAGDGNWIFTLVDGSRWQQTDGMAFAVAPRSGETVTVRRAALGSYKLVVGRQPGVRVRRGS